MLMDVGEENVPILIESLRYSPRMNDYHIRRAIVFLAGDRTKEAILEALPLHHGLVTAVVQQGWAGDARETLITELASTRHYLPTEWIEAVASLRDPETYPLLRQHFIEGQNRVSTYRAIQDLPIEHMPDAVERAWSRSKHSDVFTVVPMAAIALRYGHLDALEVLADALAHEGTDSEWLAREARSAVLRHTEFRGTNDELARWVQENREQLEFNSERQRFETRKEAEPPISPAPETGGDR